MKRLKYEEPVFHCIQIVEESMILQGSSVIDNPGIGGPGVIIIE